MRQTVLFMIAIMVCACAATSSAPQSTAEVVRRTPTMDEVLYEEAAAALSEEKCPDFSRVRPEVVVQVFEKPFETSPADREWLTRLATRVAEFSKGTVLLHEASSEEARSFPFRRKGTGIYLILLGKKRQKIIFGPSTTPFRCVE